MSEVWEYIEELEMRIKDFEQEIEATDNAYEKTWLRQEE